MQTVFTKTQSSPGSSSRSSEKSFQLIRQGKSDTFAAELKQASYKEKQGVFEPKTIEKDRINRIKKQNLSVDQTPVDDQKEPFESENGKIRTETVNADIQNQAAELLQILGIDPGQADPVFMEKLTSLLEGIGQGSVPDMGLNNLLKQLELLKQGSITVPNLDRSQLLSLQEVLEQVLKGLKEIPGTRPGVVGSIDLSGLKGQDVEAEEIVNGLKQLLASLTEDIQKKPGKDPLTAPIETLSHVNRAELGKMENGLQNSSLSRYHLKNEKEVLTQGVEADGQFVTEPDKKEQQTSQVNKAYAEQGGQGTGAKGLPQQEKENPFRLNLSENTQQTSARQDMISSSARYPETVQNNQEIINLPRMTQTVFNQIVQKAKLINLPDLAEMKIQLKPDFLGKLHLNVSVENGVVTAKFNAESHQVKAIIETNLNTLRDALSEQGVKVDQLVVNVGTGTDYSGFQRQTGGQHQNLGSKAKGGVAVRDEYEAGLASQILASAITDVYGSKVNFTA